ncbi:hypothetical protein jhhlp_001609 [Lomentospora prolificans]|uniref:Calcineurin-like phosphoesterase domain-containing protein n=1 Tax=Lomentospora prolificans TaxID=41688 RepID=A0A2N3NIN0_9PEZI|nr:hypothetical protein jhhlp_001609 [Lomentospora prolificans]
MAPVAFQIMSDLHLETHPTYDYDIKLTAPYLALLGDIGHVGDEGLYKFFEKLLKRYWVVFFLLGNHEPTYQTWQVAKDRIRAFERRMEQLRSRSTIGKFVFLDQTRYDVTDTLTVLGCTLFTHVSPEQAKDVEDRMVDFEGIREWTVDDHNRAHRSDVEWLNSQVAAISAAEPNREIVIFTHHCPTRDERALDPRHIGSPVSTGFVCDMRAEQCWQHESVVCWGFGHTHFSCDYVDEHGTRVVANQKGYHMAQEKQFSLKKIFLVGRD